MPSPSDTPLDSTQLAEVHGGMNTNGFRRSPDIVDLRSRDDIAQDNQNYQGWGSGSPFVPTAPDVGVPAGSRDLGKDLGRDILDGAPSGPGDFGTGGDLVG